MVVVIKIKIINDENNILSKNDIYYVNINLLKKIDDNLWIKLNKEYQENLNKHIEDIYGKIIIMKIIIIPQQITRKYQIQILVFWKMKI